MENCQDFIGEAVTLLITVIVGLIRRKIEIKKIKNEYEKYN